MNPATKEMGVGALVVAVLAGMLMFSYGSRATVETAATTYLLSATFNRVDGLFEGDDVRLGGIKVGVVEKQTLTDEYRAEVSLRIDSSVMLPIDTSAGIHTDGLFGSKYVVLDPGGEETFMKSGDRFDFTQDAVVVGELLELIISQGKANREKDK